MKFFLIGTVSIFIMSCANLQKSKKYLGDWNVFSQIEVNKDTQSDIKRKFGAPDELYTEQLGPNEEQWNYMRNEIPKIRVLFVNKVLQFSSMSIWDGEAVTDIPYLLKEFPGKWEVVQARVEVPHAMPFLCYLVDESSGKGIEIHAYKKIAESISKWNPKLSKGHYKKPRKYPDVDENRCAWLKELIKK